MPINSDKSQKKILHELANAYGIQTSYYDISRKRRVANDDALFATINALGNKIENSNALPSALRKYQLEQLQQKIAPVTVAWNGHLPPISLQLTSDESLAKIKCQLLCENGFILDCEFDLSKLTTLNSVIFNDTTYVTKAIEIKEKLPYGYHSLIIKFSNFQSETFIISAPEYLPLKNLTHNAQGVGVFVPMYALHSEQSFGCGDFTDFKNFISWTADSGGNFVSTLPIHATYLNDLVEISPYSPVSRLFWNELYLDIKLIPEFAGEHIPDEVAQLNTTHLVDYKNTIRLKYQLLEKMCQKCLAQEDRKTEFFKFLDENPKIQDYAAFRANIHLTQTGWSNWEPNQQAGDLPEKIKQDPHYFFHAYVQWQTYLQLLALIDHAKSKNVMLYLDAPVGIHREGFDTWQYAAEFPKKVSAGAPPDPGFIYGQNWGIAPLHPINIRKQQYRYFISCLKTILPFVDILRLDHVMGLHRLYWIPDNFPADQGVYVHYEAEELYAILCLESSKYNVVLIGENLGTVPQYINKTLKSHHFLSMHVLQYTIDMGNCLEEKIPKNSMASLNTHDMFPFAGYFQGLDLTEKVKLHVLDEKTLAEEMQQREVRLEELEITLKKQGFLENDQQDLLKNTLYGSWFFLASSAARYFLINLEDLWFETQAQNIPSTASNLSISWRRKTKYTLEEIEKKTDFKILLNELVKRRNTAKKSKKRLTKTKLVQSIPSSNAQMHYDFSLLTADDIYLFNEGRNFQLYNKLGAHYINNNLRHGVYFAVWAPNAKYVSVISDFNYWDCAAHPLAPRESSGIWEGFITALRPKEIYKYHIESNYNNYQVSKADPFAFYSEIAPKTASIVYDFHYQWQDQLWMENRHKVGQRHQPFSIYELHFGSWRRLPEDNNRFLTYREMADYLPEYIKQLGYTHVEFMPLMEHPFYDSWGYQITGYFAATSRYGSPEDFMYLIDCLHRHGIGVILDWVPSHFPYDLHGLSYFDGTHLFEHADPRKGFHPDWTSAIFNYGRKEVCAFLINSALFWLDKYHIDGLRVDGVASMLYLDYSRKENEWLPNLFGGRENLEAIDFLKQLNEEIYKYFPDVHTIAEESTSWRGVSAPTYLGGLGFGYKWDMGWMHDTLHYFSFDPIYRSFHQNELSFRMVYAFHENFMLPLSHDEVVHGKGSILAKMPGNDADKFANVRLLYGYMFAQPGKKLLFMGNEIGSWREWNANQSLDWHLLDYTPHLGIQKWVQHLNFIYRHEPALHAYDCDPQGFQWIDCNDNSHSTISFLRKSSNPDETIAVILNATPMRWENYRLGIPDSGHWKIIANSDAAIFGGYATDLGEIYAEDIPFHHFPYSININLPALGIIFLKRMV